MNRYLTSTLWIYLSLLASLYAQKNNAQIDSLRNLLKTEQNADSSVKILLGLSDQFASQHLDSSLYYAQEALKIVNSKNDNQNVSIRNKLGIIYINKGAYNKAIYQFLEGLKIVEQMGNLEKQIVFLVNIGALYDREKDYDNAENYYTKAIKIINATESLPKEYKANYLANIYNNLANVHGNRNDTTMMMVYYGKALQHMDFKGNEHIQAVVSNNIGRIQLEKGELSSAYENISKALDLRLQLEDLKGQAQCYRNLGFYYYRKQKYDSSVQSFNKSIRLAKRVGSLEEVVESSEGLSRVYERTGDIDSAYAKFKHFKMLNDSLYDEKRVNEIARIASDYEFEKEQAIFQAEQRKKELRFYILLGVMFTTVIIFGLFVIIQRARIRNAKLKNESLKLQQKSLELEKENLNITLNHKNKEMTTKVLYLYKKNELVDSVIGQLKELQTNVKSENKPVVRRVIKNLSEVINEDSWKEFELRFNEVHQEFYKNLETQFPDITPNERKLCAFLKLNMTSKEISSLTGQSIRSIDVARTRLRKKLGLTNTDTGLVDFLLTI